MQSIVVIILAGLLGTAAMTAVMGFFNRESWGRVDMVRAVGSLVTGEEESAIVPGLVIHFLNGILFAFIYAAIMSLFPAEAVLGVVSAGGAIGVSHGFLVAFGLVLVSPYHPVERYANVGLQVAIAHFIGHVFYGVVVGLMIGLTRTRLDFVPTLTSSLAP